MSEEKKLILKMLKENKINEDEALKLLEAINDNKNINKDDENENFSTSGFVSKIINGVEKALTLASNKIINTDYDFVGFSFSNFKGKTEKRYNFDIDKDINLFIKNKNNIVEIKSSLSNSIEVIAKIQYDIDVLNENSDFIDSKIDECDYYFGINDKLSTKNYTVHFQIFVPDNFTNSINVINSNSIIKLNGLNSKNINLKTTNAKIVLQDVRSEDIVVNTSNSKILLEEIKSKTLEAQTSNAKIEVYDCSSEYLKAITSNAKILLEDVEIANIFTKTSNASIDISEIDSNEISAKTSNSSIYLSEFGDNIKKIIANTKNGNIHIEELNLKRSIKVITNGNNSSGFDSKFTSITKSENTIVATSPLYDENDESTLNIEAYTTNGKLIIE